MMEENIYYWLFRSQLIHVSHVFEVKRKRQKSEFHANEMTLCLAIQKERKNNKPTIQLYLKGMPAFIDISM